MADKSYDLLDELDSLELDLICAEFDLIDAQVELIHAEEMADRAKYAELFRK